MIWEKYRGTGRTKKSIDWDRVWQENPSYKTVLGIDDSTPAKAKYTLQRVYNMMTRVRVIKRKVQEPVVEQPQPAVELKYCPHCGNHLAIITRALALAARMKGGVR